MATMSKKPRAAKAGAKTKPRQPARSRKRKSLADLNAWLSANHDALLSKAARNSIRLTGKPSFGGSAGGRRKSA